MAPTTVWELAAECECSVSTVVFQLVTMGTWSADGSVDEAVATTIEALLQDPDRRNVRTAHRERLEPRSLARTLLDSRAYEASAPISHLAAATSSTEEAVREAADSLVGQGLIEYSTDNETVSVIPHRARELRAVATGELETGEHDPPSA